MGREFDFNVEFLMNGERGVNIRDGGQRLRLVVGFREDLRREREDRRLSSERPVRPENRRDVYLQVNDSYPPGSRPTPVLCVTSSHMVYPRI